MKKMNVLKKVGTGIMTLTAGVLLAACSSESSADMAQSTSGFYNIWNMTR